MFSVRNTVFVVLVSAAAPAWAAPQGEQVSDEQLAVSTVAMVQTCQEKYPTWGITLEKAINDPSMTDDVKALIRKVNTDPAYQGQVAMIKSTSQSHGMDQMMPVVCEGLKKQIEGAKK